MPSLGSVTVRTGSADIFRVVDGSDHFAVGVVDGEEAVDRRAESRGLHFDENLVALLAGRRRNTSTSRSFLIVPSTAHGNEDFCAASKPPLSSFSATTGSESRTQQHVFVRFAARVRPRRASLRRASRPSAVRVRFPLPESPMRSAGKLFGTFDLLCTKHFELRGVGADYLYFLHGREVIPTQRELLLLAGFHNERHGIEELGRWLFLCGRLLVLRKVAEVANASGRSKEAEEETHGMWGGGARGRESSR